MQVMIWYFFLSILHLPVGASVPTEFSVSVRMPNLRRVPNVGEMYLCTYLPVQDSPEPLNIIRYDPLATMANVHHMSLFGCDSPGLMSTGYNQVMFLFSDESESLQFLFVSCKSLNRL